MKRQNNLLWLCGLIAVLALFAAGSGVFWPGSAAHFDFTTLRGETVAIQGGGLYHYDSVSGAAQAVANDVVTLLLGVPLLVVATLLAARGSLRGRVLLTGALGYFLYTYGALALMAAYNELFLVYVAVFSASLFGFIMALSSLDTAELAQRISSGFPRRGSAIFFILLGLMLSLLWFGRIVGGLQAGAPPVGLESYTTLVIQALDLGVIAPAAVLTAVLLLRRAALGYLLAATVLVLGLAMGAATSAMVIGQILAGSAVSPAEVVIFPGIALVDIALTALMLRSIRPLPLRQSLPGSRDLTVAADALAVKARG